MARFDDFEWDEKKAASNFRKHGITFEEATFAFDDPRGYDFADRLHPERLVLIARCPPNRMVVVVYTEVTADHHIRIISARRATTHEKKLYQNG